MPENKRFYFIQQIERTADIYIFGDITEWPWEEFGDKSAFGIVNEINSLDADVINVHIDSYGGSIKEGWGMYNALRQTKAVVHTYADGFVCSAALYPFLAGSTRTASSVSAFYLHEGLTGAYGYADDLRKAADEIELLTDIGITAFTENTDLDADAVRDLMSKETWMSAQQALESITVIRTAERSPSAMSPLQSQPTRRSTSESTRSPRRFRAPPRPISLMPHISPRKTV